MRSMSLLRVACKATGFVTLSATHKPKLPTSKKQQLSKPSATHDTFDFAGQAAQSRKAKLKLKHRYKQMHLLKLEYDQYKKAKATMKQAFSK